MSWKIVLGKPNDSYIIGKRWVKKNIAKSDRISKALHKEKGCPGDIYFIGQHYYQDSEKMVDLWVCMETGKIMTKAPNFTQVSRAQPKPKPKPQPKYQKKPKKTVVEEPKEERIEPVAKAEDKKKEESKTPRATKDTSVSEVKGIGTAAFGKLSAAGIKTIGDLLKMHSQEIAAAIGRKSDSQIKKWQENAKELIS